MKILIFDFLPFIFLLYHLVDLNKYDIISFMRIGIDCRTILNPEKGEGAGIGHYVYQLVRYLLLCDKENTYFLFFDHSVRTKTLKKFSQPNVNICFFPFRQYKKFLSHPYSSLLANAFLSKDELDVLHSPSIVLPPDVDVADVITVHDLSVYKFPEWYSRDKNKNLFLKFREKISEVLQKAKIIISPSLSTAKDLEEIFDIPFKKIKIIPHGVDERFYQKSPQNQINKIKNKYKIKGKYLLFLGNLEERKNILRIISSYERFRDHFPSLNYNLCLAGAAKESLTKIKKKIAVSPYRSQIILTGYIAPDDINPLFEGATLFIFPSLYEGFGLPVLEAMAKKVPVITSNSSSLPEVASNCALLVDPYDISAITKAIETIILKRKEIEPMIKMAYQRSRQFSWLKTAEQTLEVYKKIK
jgi:hypothetical protein